jgi:hypothetical protein
MGGTALRRYLVNGEDLSDEQLMVMFRYGNRTAFELLFEKHRGSVFNFTRRMLGNRTAAEDVCQDVFLGMVRAASTYEPETMATVTGISEQDELNGFEFMRGKGCDNCHGTGYRGRTGIYEIMPFTQEIRKLIAANVPAEALRQAAIDAGMTTFRRDAICKASHGITTLEEALGVTIGAE